MTERNILPPRSCVIKYPGVCDVVPLFSSNLSNLSNDKLFVAFFFHDIT